MTTHPTHTAGKTGKSFDTQMLDLQQGLAMAYAEELQRLRRENAALRKTIAEFPATASELQDQVTALECRLRAYREATS